MLLESMVGNLKIFQDNPKGTYRGIRREFFPLWNGWEMLEQGRSIQEIDTAVEEFYINFYYYHLKLDLLENQNIAYILLNFATLHGKKKCLQKLQKVSGGIDKFNALGKAGEYQLIIEILDFYEYIRSTDTKWVFDAYSKLLITN